jgi:diguanylate cyclase (GGDEF)-like protein
MTSLLTASVLRNAASFAGVLCILLGGTWAVINATTSHLLYENATSTARSWAQYLASNATDLEQIAGGERPSIGSMAFFQHSQKSDQVFRYEIYDRHGFSLLVSDHNNVALADISEFSPDAARAAKTGQAVVGTREGVGPDQPSFFAQAFVPVLANDRVIAVVAAYVDQTEQRNSFNATFLRAAAALCLLTGLSFGVPTIAWYRRTKEKQIADRRVRFLAHHDALTGLANRAQLLEQLEKALAILPVRRGGLALHFIDLDRFKEINDALGHDAGDFLLKTVAERLRAVTRNDDIAARLGGDEFVVVQTGISDKREAEDFAARLVSAVTAPMMLRDHEIVATASVGVALAPADGTDPERLLKSADLALYKSKADGRNCIQFFMPEMDAALQMRLSMERAIRDAVLHERFILHYQPVFEISGHRLIGFEALVRLPAADGSLIPPNEFIPLAEDMRAIDKIGAWVLREACRAAATWPEPLTVAVNLSPAQFESGRVSAIVAAALEESGLAAHRLELEITETLLLGNSEAILMELQSLKAMGVAIVMDDFGTGYSSLSYLWRFPFDKIKIDRSFMQGFEVCGRDAETVVKTIIALGRELHMRVTVEGVETAQQAAFLDGANADQVQGYYFGRPTPGPEISVELLKHFKKGFPAQPRGSHEASHGSSERSKQSA